MFKKASLVLLLLGVGMIVPTSARAQMQQGYENDQPTVTVDRSALEDLKGYQPPPMFGADLMPPTTNRLAPRQAPSKNVEVTSPSLPPAPLTAPNAEDLLNHPTQNFHVLTERNASMTTPDGPVDSPDGPLLPLPDDEYSSSVKTNKPPLVKKEPKKEEPKKPDKKKDAPQKEKTEKKKTAAAIPVPTPTAAPKTVTIEATKIIPPNPNAYKPKAPQSMPAVPPIKVEKNILPPLSGSPLPSLPPTTDTTQAIEKPTPGLRMMDAALERQMESDETKIKEQLAETDIKTVKPGTETKKSAPLKTSDKTLVFAGNQLTLSDKMKGQIKTLILPEIQKDKTSRIQIISFATAPDKTEASARRISLLRSLAVRDYLKDLHIDTSRIDVRALPGDGNSVPPDKVDIILLK